MFPCPVPTADLDNTEVDPYKLTPTGQRVLLRLASVSETTEGGIHLTGESSETPQVGTVIAVGRNVRGIQPGTHVQFAKHCPGQEFEKDEETFKLVPVDDLIGSINLPS